MATVSDIDTNAAVSKFLNRQVVVPRSGTQDQGDEVAALIEATAIRFLISPQSALTLILMAKNQLQQIVISDLALIDYIIAAIGDVNNPDLIVTDTSSLVDAQTALVEVDRLGSFSNTTAAFTRYTSAVSTFLNKQLAISVKRSNSGELERTGSEAKQDLSSAVGLFNSTHAVMISGLVELINSVNDFRSVNLTKIVSADTVARVKSSLQQVQQGMAANALSPTVAAIELLAGSAALQSISSSQDIYDPTVETGIFPAGRNITVSSAPIGAFLISSVSASSGFSVGSGQINFGITLDELGTNPFTATFGIPVSGSPTNRAWIVSSPLPATVLLPSGSKSLFLQLNGAVGGAYKDIDLSAAGTSTTLTALAIIINSALGADATLTVNTRGDGLFEFIFVGSDPVTSIVVLGLGNGSVDPVSGIYTASNPSVHTQLGLVAGQVSTDKTLITKAQLIDRINSAISPRGNAVSAGNFIQITSASSAVTSSVRVSTQTYPGFGFSTTLATAIPPFLVLMENGQPIDPDSLGVFIGSSMAVTDSVSSDRSGVFIISDILGNQLLCDTTLPRAVSNSVTILAPSVASVQSLLLQLSGFSGVFDKDAQNVQKVAAPLLSKQATQAQLGDATKLLNAVRLNVTNQAGTGLLDVMSAVVVRDDQSEFATAAKTLIQSLEERGLDKASDLLTSAQFSAFFALTNEAASNSGAFLNSIEKVMTVAFSTTTIESQIQDAKPSGTTPSDILPPLETSD